MEKNGWKTLAIVFMILFVLGILFLIWLYGVGTDTINDLENICAYNICGYDPEVAYYDYLIDEGICECYDSEMNIIKQEYIG